MQGTRRRYTPLLRASVAVALAAVAAIAILAPGTAALATLVVLIGASGAIGWWLGRRSGMSAASASAARSERDRLLLRETAARAFRAQETERMRIARELQEETAQTLSALLLHLQVARGIEDAAARATVLDEIRAGLTDATDTVRRFARGLYPPALNDAGLAAAVIAYADSLTGSGAPSITVAAGDIVGLLSRERELALYRVLQEAIGNAVRHSRARNVRVHLERAGDEIVARVEDDGAGFDVAEREADHPCLGLFGMRERALHAGGVTRVDSAPGGGTRVVTSFPLAEPIAARARLTIVPRPLAVAE
jgi:signal transduction histidine kinase